MFKRSIKKGILLILSVLLLLPVVLPAEDNDAVSIREAIRLSKNGDYQGAITIFNELLKKDDYIKNPAVHFHLGLTYYSSGKYNEALNEFTTTVNLDPTKEMPYYFMGMIYEAKALAETDPLKDRELKNKAVIAWDNFLKYAAADKKDKIKIAEKHLNLLKEELSEK